MQKPKVYFANMWVTEDENLQKKLLRLMNAAGMFAIDFDKKFTAIKIHFGELGNLAYLRPNYAKTVVDAVKGLGGKPFLTDANTLYVGGRKNALDHLDTAYLNGFSPFSTGCHILIADGLKGTDEALLPVPGGELVERAKIGRAIADADVVISLTHFKCHELTGIGGALKNIGMGSGSRAGKMEMHSDGKPVVDQKICIGCGRCAEVCAHSAITLSESKACINHNNCVGCGRCVATCPVDAIDPANDSANDDLSKKIAEYAAAVLHGKPHFHISFVVDVTPFCDCHGENDVPIVPDVGMFASFDPVALDMACARAVNHQTPNPDSLLGRSGKMSEDHFSSVSPGTDWRVGLNHAMKLGLGTTDYELVTI